MIQAGKRLHGMCYFSGRLYTIEARRKGRHNSFRLAVYSVTDQATIILQDTLDLDEPVYKPRVDRQSGQVYISCGPHGVCVVRYDGRKLVRVATLSKDMGSAISLAVMSQDTMYVGEEYTYTVYLRSATQDRDIASLKEPWKERKWPNGIAVLGDTILVGYEDHDLALYRHGVSTPVKKLPQPPGLDDVSGLTTDYHSSFVLAGRDSDTVYVFDITGKRTHNIPIPGNRRLWDCTVVERELWVGCYDGDIIVLSSE